MISFSFFCEYIIKITQIFNKATHILNTYNGDKIKIKTQNVQPSRHRLNNNRRVLIVYGNVQKIS